MDDYRFERIRKLGGERYASWLAAGYREFWQDYALGKSTPYLLQRPVEDADGTRLFFVDVWVYDTSVWPNYPGDSVSYHADVQFNVHLGQQTFDVGLHAPGTPAETEAFFLRIYNAMGCEPYGD